MRVIGWIASVVAMILSVILILVTLFSLASDTKTSFIWLCLSVVALISFIFFTNPAIRNGVGISRFKPLYSYAGIILTLVVAVVCFGIGCMHFSDDDTVAASDTTDNMTDSAAANAAASATPAPVNLAFFECGAVNKNDRKLLDVNGGDSVYDHQGLTVYGAPVNYALVMKKSSDLSRAVLFSAKDDTVTKIAQNINAKLGPKACELDKDNFCAVSNDDRDDQFQRMRLSVSKDKTDVILQCIKD